jgi:hypothetical protein
MSNLGIKASKEDVDVKSALDKELSFTSGLNVFKVYRVIHMGATGQEAHGLDYPPTFDFMQPFLTGYQVGSSGYYGGYTSVVEVDDTYVYAPEGTYVILYIDPLDE